jgi:hypothetical protein
MRERISMSDRLISEGILDLLIRVELHFNPCECVGAISKLPAYNADELWLGNLFSSSQQLSQCPSGYPLVFHTRQLQLRQIVTRDLTIPSSVGIVA